MISLTTRLGSISQSWPPSIRRELNRYIRRFYRKGGCENAGLNDIHRQPYWFLLPTWLRKKYNHNTSSRISKKVLDDILWAQYCVFLSIRIKDDLYDGEEIASPLFFAADQFLSEACDVLFRHLKGVPRFWPIFTGSLKETITAFWEVDALQQRDRVSLTRMKIGYARVSSIFKIGSAAICHLAGHGRDISTVESATDELAIAGQMLDDFHDMNEDLSRKRLNYAVRFLLGSSGPYGENREDTLQLLAERVLYTDRVTRLFDEVIGHVQAAESSLNRLELSGAEQYFPAYVESLEILRDKLREKQANRIFGTAISRDA